MKFFVSTLDRLRRSVKTGDESSDRIAIVHVDRAVPDDDEFVLDVVISKDGQRTTVLIGSAALSDIARARDFGPRLIELLEAERPGALLIDLRQVAQLSSESLNQLISVNCHARALGIQLVLANLCQPLREVFRITRLDRLFELADQN